MLVMVLDTSGLHLEWIREQHVSRVAAGEGKRRPARMEEAARALEPGVSCLLQAAPHQGISSMAEMSPL